MDHMADFFGTISFWAGLIDIPLLILLWLLYFRRQKRAERMLAELATELDQMRTIAMDAVDEAQQAKMLLAELLDVSGGRKLGHQAIDPNAIVAWVLTNRQRILTALSIEQKDARNE